MSDKFKYLRSVLEFCAIEREHITIQKIVKRFEIERKVALGIVNDLEGCKFIEKSGLSSYRFVGNDLKKVL